jgi:hypothetical protein
MHQQCHITSLTPPTPHIDNNNNSPHPRYKRELVGTRRMWRATSEQGKARRWAASWAQMTRHVIWALVCFNLFNLYFTDLSSQFMMPEFTTNESRWLVGGISSPYTHGWPTTAPTFNTTTAPAFTTTAFAFTTTNESWWLVGGISFPYTHGWPTTTPTFTTTTAPAFTTTNESWWLIGRFSFLYHHGTYVYGHQRVMMTRWWVFFSFQPQHPPLPPALHHHQRVFATRWWALATMVGPWPPVRDATFVASLFILI